MRRPLIVFSLSILCASCAGRPVSAPPADAIRFDTVADKHAAFARAYDSFRRGDIDSALPIFTALATSYPELADYNLYFVGVIDVRGGRDDAAEPAFSRLLQEYPRSVKAPVAALELGKLLVRTGRVDQGRTWLHSALSAPDAPTVQVARLALADADERSGDVAAAYAGFTQVRHDAVGSAAARTAKERVMELRATHPELSPAGAALLEEARQLLAEHDYAAAKETAAGLLERSESVSAPAVEMGDAMRVLADASYGLGDVSGALALLRQLVDRYPDSVAAPDALFRRASVLWNRDRDEEALDNFDEFLRRYPRHQRAAEALYAIGRIHERAGAARRAIAAYVELARRYPDDKLSGEAQWRVGWIYYLAADWSEAAAAFARLADRDSSRQRDAAAYWEARALEHRGDSAGAPALYHGIVQRDPNGYYAMWAQRRLAAEAGQPIFLPGGTPAGPELRPPQAAPVAPAPLADTFHLIRGNELQAMGLYNMARQELAAIERETRADATVSRYLLRAYQAVDGYAAALRLLRRLGADADLSPAERERLLYPLAFWTAVRHEAQANSVDPLLVEAIMRQESLFDPEVRSSAGALGLMQVMPATAQRVGGGSVDRNDLLQPDLNIQLGVRELTGLLARFRGDVLKAVAAYNGGASAVEKWEARAPDREPDEFVEAISFRETRDYVKRVVSHYRAYRQLYGTN